MRRGAPSPAESLPSGFLYEPGFLSEAEESELLHRFQTLSFEAFDFHGYMAKRRIVQYGLEYNFGSRTATATQPFADFLIPLRDRAAQRARLPADEITEAIVTEYPPGAPIGWHRDAPQFETIIGISLGGSCRMRLKRYGTPGKIASVMLEPRSLYVISGEARWQWQHSIPAVQQLRYSITFRGLRRQRKKGAA